MSIAVATAAAAGNSTDATDLMYVYNGTLSKIRAARPAAAGGAHPE